MIRRAEVLCSVLLVTGTACAAPPEGPRPYDVLLAGGFFSGHWWVPREVLGMANRDPSPGELERMKALVEETMRAGALGLSTGLLYVPANYAKTEESIELAKIAARYGGIYVTHMRNEGSGLLDSV